MKNENNNSLPQSHRLLQRSSNISMQTGSRRPNCKSSGFEGIRFIVAGHTELMHKAEQI
jgi:hypothetical protein